MRFSAVFEPRMPLRTVQAEDRPEDPAPPRLAASPVLPSQEPPEDLDQRVRQIGEWQLEDW